MTDLLLEACGLHKNFDGVTALADFSWALRRGEVLGLIGPNGAGKTTLFNVVSGFVRPDSGRVTFKGRSLLRLCPYRVARLGISRTFQEVSLVRHISVLENVLLAYPSQPGERLDHVFFAWARVRAAEAANRKEALSLLERLGLSGKAAERADALSYGEQKLLALACCVATRADLLLLDEPVAGIAPETMERILSLISSLPNEGRTVVLIEHDLAAVTRVCQRVVFMDAGVTVREGTPEEVRNDPRVIDAYLD
jgi:ABC-type branched-subunit amino acid transport system ATPase component